MIPYINKLANEGTIAYDEVQRTTKKGAKFIVNKTRINIDRVEHKGVTDVLVMTNNKHELLAIGHTAITKKLKEIRKQN